MVERWKLSLCFLWGPATSGLFSEAMLFTGRIPTNLLRVPQPLPDIPLLGFFHRRASIAITNGRTTIAVQFHLDWSRSRQYLRGDPPARWAGNDWKMLRSQEKRKEKIRYFPCMRYTLLSQCTSCILEWSNMCKLCLWNCAYRQRTPQNRPQNKYSQTIDQSKTSIYQSTTVQSRSKLMPNQFSYVGKREMLCRKAPLLGPQLQETVELNENTRRMPVAQLKKPKEACLDSHSTLPPFHPSYFHAHPSPWSGKWPAGNFCYPKIRGLKK